MFDPRPLAASWTEWFTDEQFLNNEPWRWLALLGTLLVSFVAGKVIGFVLAHWSERMSRRGGASVLATVLKSMSGPATMFMLAGGLYVASTFMNLEYRANGVVQSVRPFWINICRTIAVLAVAWLLFALVDLIENILAHWTSKTKTQLDDQLVPMVRKSLRVFVVIIAALFIAQNIFKWDIAALIAGLGIGGLALALAAKDMLANLFGSVVIFSDRPFQLDDWVRIDDKEGFVEEVGFRSTRIRTFYGELIVIPNAKVADAAIENVSARPYIRRNLHITVTYDTAPEKMEEAFAILHDMLDARREHWAPDRDPKVHFNDFNAASLNIWVAYWYAPPDFWEYQAFSHDFNMELLRRFNEAGIEFAFPTQTLYVKQDSPFEAQLRMEQGG